MPYDPDRHHRRSIRLRGYDYAQAGAYFITICTQDRECLFGDVVEGEMRLNDAGRMVERWWAELGEKYPAVIPGAGVVMPNHFHGVVLITDQPVGADLRVCPDQGAHTGAPLQRPGDAPVRPDLRVCPELSAIVQWFKTMTTNEYIRGVRTLGWNAFPGKLWQRNYYEQVIRDDGSWNAIRHYILDNPARWAEDDENPEKER